MIRVLAWFLLAAIIFWTNIPASNIVQKIGIVAGCLLFSAPILMSIKWWCYAEKINFSRNRLVLNHIVAPVAAIINPMIVLTGLLYINYILIFQAIMTFIVFLPSGYLEFFWSKRWGDLKLSSDSGNVDQKVYIRLRNLALGSIFLPLPMLYIAQQLQEGSLGLLK